MTSAIDPSEEISKTCKQLRLFFLVEYPFHLDEEGWPENAIDPTYPHEYYFDLGKNPPEPNPNFNNNNLNVNQVETNANGRLSIPIRRHRPGSTDPTHREIIDPTPSPIPTTTRVPSTRQSTRSGTFTIPRQNKASTITNPDERPIKPMKDTSVYHQPLSGKPPAPKKSSLKLPKIKQTPTPSQSDSYRSIPSRRENQSITPRRPIFADIFIKTPRSIPSGRTRSRPVVVEEYIDDDYYFDDDQDEEYLTYDEPIPRKVISYQEVSGMTTRERENYMMSRNQHLVRSQPTPIRRIIYPHQSKPFDLF